MARATDPSRPGGRRIAFDLVGDSHGIVEGGGHFSVPIEHAQAILKRLLALYAPVC